jgi:hypothetical protein
MVPRRRLLTKHGPKCLALVLLSALTVVAWGFEQTKDEKRAPASNAKSEKSGLKPSKPAAKSTKSATKTDKPLLLSNDESETKSADGADNSRCHVCHINFSQEQLAVRHAAAGVGCVKCHGPSDAHIDDESWTSGGKGTPPDTMYPGGKINRFCLTCHELNDHDPDRKCTFPGLNGKKVCTDCHGKHRLKSRKCKWK